MQAFDHYFALLSKNRARIQRVFFLAVLILLIYKFFAGLMIHQVTENPLRYQEVDITYWLFMALKLPSLISGKWALIFDLALIAACVGCIVRPRSHSLPLLLYILYFIYFALFNMSAGHHFNNVGILLTAFAFAFGEKSFAYCWFYARLLFLFVMGSAGIWKIVRGDFMFRDQLNMIILENKIKMLAEKPDSLQHSFYMLFIKHPGLSQFTWILLMLIEVSFLIGFFTFRADKFLVLLYILFFLGGLFITGIYNIENLICLLTMLPFCKLIARCPDAQQLIN